MHLNIITHNSDKMALVLSVKTAKLHREKCQVWRIHI